MLTHRSHIVPLSPALLVAAANAFIGVSEQGGDTLQKMKPRPHNRYRPALVGSKLR